MTRSLAVLRIWLLLVVVCGSFGKETAQDKAWKVCNSLVSNGKGRMKVLTIGLLSFTFLLITSDLYVFDLPPASLRGDENSSRLYLGDSAPLRLSEKWPNLASDPRWAAIKAELYNSFTVSDTVSEYLLFITRNTATGNGSLGVTYDLKAHKVYRGYRFNGARAQVMISARTQMLFYGLRETTTQDGLEIAQFTFNSPILLKASTIQRSSPWRVLCESSKTASITVRESETAGCEAVRLTKVVKGFIDGSQVYLFGPKHIYIFELDAFTRPGSAVPLTGKAYTGFFICHPDYLRWAIVFLLLLGLLVLLVLAVLWCCKRRKGGEDSKAQRRAGTGTSSKRSGKTRAAATVRSIRSKKRSIKTKKSSGPAGKSSSGRASRKSKSSSGQAAAARPAKKANSGRGQVGAKNPVGIHRRRWHWMAAALGKGKGGGQKSSKSRRVT